MSAVFSHGRLRLYLLKLLGGGPRHGYELIRLLENRFLGLYAPSAGTIYPASPGWRPMAWSPTPPPAAARSTRSPRPAGPSSPSGPTSWPRWRPRSTPPWPTSARSPRRWSGVCRAPCATSRRSCAPPRGRCRHHARRNGSNGARSGSAARSTVPRPRRRPPRPGRSRTWSAPPSCWSPRCGTRWHAGAARRIICGWPPR
ncbi:helix-turn-helix transcriptional regulator [Luedemannella flava]